MNIEILQNYNRKYRGKFPFLEELNEDWSRSKPLQGYKILHNIPLTKETLLKLESLFLAGADVTVTHLKLQGLTPKKECIALLKEAGVNVETEHHNIQGIFDFGLDCCAQIPHMNDVTITRGYVELTQPGTTIYKKMNLNAPVISVDDSKLKYLEGMYGTGEACVRAMKAFLDEDINDKHIVLFGYGKVGRGIVKHLTKETSNITIIENNPVFLDEINKLGYRCFYSDDKKEIVDAMNNAFAVITATGENGVVSRICSEKQINPEIHLLNMGATDEYGDEFTSDRIFANRTPINFLLDTPTDIRYIDPIFYVHNKVCLNLLKASEAVYSPLPDDLDIPLIRKWSRVHNVNCSDILAL